VAIVTGRISLRSPEYSPISSSVSDVRGDELALPLPPGDGVGHQDQRGRLRGGHRGRADQRLAGAARQHDDAGPAGPEPVDRLLLVGPQRPAVLDQVDLVRLAVDVPGQVLGRPAELEQPLLEPPALGRVHDDRVLVDQVAEHPGELLALGDLDQHRAVERLEHQAVRRMVDQLQPSVPVHRLGDVDEQRVRHRVPRVAQQRVDDALRVVAGGARVPQPERGEPVRVDVLGRALELGERRDGHPARERVRMVDLEEERFVGLNDQGAVGHGRTSLREVRPVTRPPRSARRSRRFLMVRSLRMVTAQVCRIRGSGNRDRGR
jgi:hypothetical protein